MRELPLLLGGISVVQAPLLLLTTYPEVWLLCTVRSM